MQASCQHLLAMSPYGPAGSFIQGLAHQMAELVREDGLQPGDGRGQFRRIHAGDGLGRPSGHQQGHRFSQGIGHCRQMGQALKVVCPILMPESQAQPVTDQLQVLLDHPFADLMMLG